MPLAPLPRNESVFECDACGFTFRNYPAFTHHQRGPYTRRTCRSEQELQTMGMTFDDDGVWSLRPRAGKAETQRLTSTKSKDVAAAVTRTLALAAKAEQRKKRRIHRYEQDKARRKAKLTEPSPATVTVCHSQP